MGASSTVSSWSDVRSGFPGRTIRRYGPDTDSETFDFFTEEIVGEVQTSRPDYTASADDNVLVPGVAGNPTAVGYFGYAYYSENPGKLKLVAVDDGSGCVAPNIETIANGTYSRFPGRCSST